MSKANALEMYINVRKTKEDVKRLRKIIRQLEFMQEHQNSPEGSTLCCDVIKSTTILVRYLEELLHATDNKGRS